jgi:PhnA domain
MAIKDSNGTPLNDGDSVQVTKDLNVKGLMLKACFFESFLTWILAFLLTVFSSCKSNKPCKNY